MTQVAASECEILLSLSRAPNLARQEEAAGMAAIPNKTGQRRLS